MCRTYGLGVIPYAPLAAGFLTGKYRKGQPAPPNSRALALAGVTRDTPDPEGGVIERDERGEPTGLLKETAQELIKKILPLGIQATMMQCTASGAAYAPEEAITVEEALRWYTLGAAYSAFEENEKGSLAPGKWADFVVLSDDPLQAAEQMTGEITVLKTVVGGEIVFGK